MFDEPKKVSFVLASKIYEKELEELRKQKQKKLRQDGRTQNFEQRI